LLEQIEGFDIVVVPVGGGGLIAGVAAAIKEARPDVRVVGVQSARVPAMRVSWEAGEIRSLASANTIADGISVARVGAHTFPYCRKFVDDIVTVTDDEIAQAIMTLLEQEKLLAEGAGAVGVAALMNGRIDGVSGKRVVVIVSGGNIDTIDLAKFLERGLEQDGRLANLRVITPDKPGSVADVARIIAGHDANILQISQNRNAAEVGLREAEVELTLETRGHPHVNEIIGALSERGYVVRAPLRNVSDTP
jgi:threonine dehydratase